MANCVSVMTEMMKLSTSMECVTQKRQTVSDLLNPHSLGTMLSFGCIENLV